MKFEIIFPLSAKTSYFSGSSKSEVHTCKLVARIAQSVQCLATGCTVRGWTLEGGNIFHTVQSGPWTHPVYC
jgi:hypothetical protein